MSLKRDDIAESKKRILAVQNKLNKQAKRPIICIADDLPTPYFTRRPTGIMELDIHLGGGFPGGTVNYVSGPENSGKTLLLYRTYAMNQRIHGARSRIFHGQVEGALDYMFMRAQGVKIAVPKDNIEQYQQYLKERGQQQLTKEQVKELSSQVGEFHLCIPETQEELLWAVLEYVRTNAMQIIGVDSITAAMPSAEAILQDLSQFPQQGAHATNMKRFFQHWYPEVLTKGVVNETCAIFLNHVVYNRSKAEAAPFMQKFIKDWRPAGAPAAKHGQSCDLMIWSGAKEKEGKDKEKVVIGKEVNWETRKGKAGTRDNLCGSFTMLYNEDPMLSAAKSVIEAGTRLGLIVEAGGKLILLRPETKQPHPEFTDTTTFDSLAKKLMTDPDADYIARREVLAAAGIQCTYR